MFYPYNPKRLTTQDKEDAQLLADELHLEHSDRVMFIQGFYCGIQNREKQMDKRRKEEEED